jgi:predicted DNA-binding antitoxin AbrB/MazE fold protein
MNSLNLEAIYEHGVLKLPQQLPLPDGQKVSITIHATGVPRRRRGLIDWKGTREDLDYLILSEDNDVLEAP